MEKQFDKNIIWTIKKFSSLTSDEICSDNFIVGGCKWNLLAFPKGDDNSTHLSLYLNVANHESLPSGWRRHANFRLTVVNQALDKRSHSEVGDFEHWFDENASDWGAKLMIRLNEIRANDSEFLLNEELKIVVDIKVLQVIGESDVTEETSTITEDVHDFILLPSQAKSVSCMFERYPAIASDFRPKNPNLRTGYMSLLLSLIETICQLPQGMSKYDMFDAYAALRSLKDAGFELVWLEKKLDEVSKKMEDVKTNEAALQEMEKELKDLKRKCSVMKDLVKKKKAKVSAAKAPISFDDIVS